MLEEADAIGQSKRFGSVRVGPELGSIVTFSAFLDFLLSLFHGDPNLALSSQSTERSLLIHSIKELQCPICPTSPSPLSPSNSTFNSSTWTISTCPTTRVVQANPISAFVIQLMLNPNQRNAIRTQLSRSGFLSSQNLKSGISHPADFAQVERI